MTDPIDQLRAALADRYAIDRLIGQGGMATVYLAHDPRHDRQVAIKVLRPELAASLGPERFLREIKLAARLQHPNILAVYDSGEANGLLYYVMPFVEGESLRDRLNREQQLPIDEAVDITCQIADALQYAHTHGVIHRDIKPENVMLQGGHALVTDFGIAKAVGTVVPTSTGGPMPTSLTQAGTSVGTPFYMSPEQGAGNEHLDGRTDQYSLGCVLYEMLIGQPPFTGPNAMAILARHSMEAVPSLQVVRQAVSDELEDAIFRTLDKTPADRFPTMQAFIDALSHAGVGSPRRTTPRGTASFRRTAARTTGTIRRSTPVPRGRSWIPGWIRGTRLLWLGLGMMIVLAVAGWTVWRSIRAREGSAASTAAKLDPNRIAVLYFAGVPGSSDSLNYLADGLTETLIHELSGVSGLQVISSNGVRRYRGTDPDVRQVAHDLRTGTLVRGDIAQSGDRLRVNVALIDASTLVEIGSKTIERPRAEIFVLQDDLAREVAAFLRRQLGHEVQLRETRLATRDAAAWELFQRAQQESREADTLIAAGDTAGAERQLRRMDTLLARAAQLDAKWPAPATSRGWLAFRESRMAPNAPPQYTANLIARGLRHAEHALALDSTNADALELRGTLRYWQWLNNLAGTADDAAKLYASAERDLRASVDANPGQASAWTTLSHLLINKPAAAEAKLAALRAYEADPYFTNANVTLWRLFLTSYQLEDPLEAERWCKEGRERFAEDSRFSECELWYFSMPGAMPRFKEAWHILDRYVELSPPNQRQLNRSKGQMRIAIALARAGLSDSARHVVQRARAGPAVDSGRELAELEAIVATALDDKDEAFKQLSVYIASNPQQRQAIESWEFEPLKSDPRYLQLLGHNR